MPSERTVGVIGLGLIGRALAGRLGDAGFEVVGFDVNEKALRAFEGQKAKSAGEVARRADRIVLAVFDTSDVEQVAAEGMIFTESQGIDRATFLDLLKGSPAASPAALAKGEKMASRRFDAPDSRIRQHLKDVERILEYAARAGLALPFSEAHAKLLKKAVAAGDGELDNAAIIRRWRAS